MALQALVDAQQRQNELLKQSLQHQQQPLTSLSAPHPASLQPAAAITPAPAVTVNQLPAATFYSPTVVTVGDPRSVAAPAAASTIQRTATLQPNVTSISTESTHPDRDVVNSSRAPPAAMMSDGVVTISPSPSSVQQTVPGKTVERWENAVETVSEPAVQVTECSPTNCSKTLK